MVKIECPNCGRVFDAPDPHVADGDVYTCSNCNAEIAVDLSYEEAIEEEENEDEEEDVEKG